MDDFLNDEDKKKLAGYTEHLDNYDPKEATRQYFEQLKTDQARAYEIAGRGPLEERTEEEQAFADKNLGPAVQGLMQGGVMGTVGKVGGQVIKPAFNRIQQMMQVGNKRFPSPSTAKGLENLQKLEQAGESLPSQFGRVIRKY